ncbi:alpha-ribazole phosphatase [Neisseria sp. Ec49-e6-T10]|uniref:alpha-ribazole phosphatase n=1 Tax=Neisseria sp. Ec49-e6-T10 TaxID=3140744 RepID=UPI003EBDF1BB
MDLYFIRHTSVDVAAGVCYGQFDVGLKDSFEQEAEAVCQQIKDIRFDQVFTSPLSRCTRLAHFCGFHDANQDSRLKEMDFGSWEMQVWDHIQDQQYLHAWYEDWTHLPAQNGESLHDLYQRVALFLDELKQNAYQKVGIFTHGGVIACASVYTEQVTFEKMFENKAAYGQVIPITLV